MNGHSYKGYQINRTLGTVGFWYVSKNGTDLFYGLVNLNAAKEVVDNMTFLATVKW